MLYKNTQNEGEKSVKNKMNLKWTVTQLKQFMIDMDKWAKLIADTLPRLDGKIGLIAKDIRSQLSAADRRAFNKAIRKQITLKAKRKDAQLYANDKCYVKGHHDVIANGYQSLWDNGVDTPVQCLRCGRVDM